MQFIKMVILLIFSIHLLYGITDSLYSNDSILDAQNQIYPLQQEIKSKKIKMQAIIKNKLQPNRIESHRWRRYKVELKELTDALAYFQDIADSRTLHIQEDVSLHRKNEVRQKNLQQKKLKEQLSIIGVEIENLEMRNRLLKSEIDIKTKKRVSIQQQAGYDIDTYLDQIQSLQKKEIMDSVSFSNKIEQYKQKARDVKRKTLNEVTRIEQKLENLKSELKLNQKKLTRYQINQDEKEKLLNYYNSTK